MKKLKTDLIRVGIFILILLSLFSVFLEPFRIPSESMSPTLKRGDFVLSNNFTYGIKIPFSDLSFRLPFKEKEISIDPIYLTEFIQPKRGDVIIFKYPQDHTQNYIKRVIALPGDTVEIKAKKIFVNGSEVWAQDENILDTSGDQFQTFETKLDEKIFSYQISASNFYQVNYKKVKIPEGKIFVLGDNRDFSYDSRIWGFVDFKEVKGKAFMIWFSLSSLSRIGNQI